MFSTTVEQPSYTSITPCVGFISGLLLKFVRMMIRQKVGHRVECKLIKKSVKNLLMALLQLISLGSLRKLIIGLT